MDKNYELGIIGVELGKTNSFRKNDISRKILSLTDGSMDINEALIFIYDLCAVSKIDVPKCFEIDVEEIQWVDILVLLLGINNGLLSKN